jgi:hypothetical protein
MANNQGNTIQQGVIPQNAKGRAKQGLWGRLSGPAGYAFTAIDAYSNIKEGESAPVAIGKALVTNAFWMMMPGGFRAMLGLGLLEAAPELARAIDYAKAAHGQKSIMFGGGFTQNDGQEFMKQTGIQNMMNARNTASAIMAKHARGASKAY